MVNDSSRDRQPHDFGILLALAYAAFVRELRQALEAEGYDDLPSSFGYVARHLDEGTLTLSELAARLGMTSPGALKIVQQMQSAGYLERDADPDDKRMIRLSLSKRGRAALRAARRFHARFEKQLEEEHGARKVEGLREVLESLLDQEPGAPLALRPL
jgi:DNA-binding MarR family transcriptional regulator